MNYFFTPAIQLGGAIEGAGGLFDFNATLPLMAIQFVLLTVALTFLFYKILLIIPNFNSNFSNFLTNFKRNNLYALFRWRFQRLTFKE